MSTIIDELLVTLGLEPKGFKKGAQEVTDAEKEINRVAQQTETKRKKIDQDQGERERKNAKQVKRHTKQQLEAYNKIKHSLIGIIGAYVGLRSLTQFAANSIFDEAALGRLSGVVDMSANKIAAYGLAFKSMGGDAREASGEILKAQNVLGAMRIGQAPAAYQAYLRYGGKVSDLNSTSGYLMGISRILQHMQGNPRLRASMPYVANQLGIGYNLMQLLKQGPGSVSRQLAQYEKLTKITQEQIRNSTELQKSMAKTEEAWAQTGRILLNDINPYLLKFSKFLQEIAGWTSKEHDKLLPGLMNAANPLLGGWNLLANLGSNQSEVHIGKIVVQTQATDAAGIAASIGGQLNKQLGVQSNSGVN